MNKMAPCKGCTRRYIGCHDKCEDYAEFKRKREILLKDNYITNQVLWLNLNRFRKHGL